MHEISKKGKKCQDLVDKNLNEAWPRPGKEKQQLRSGQKHEGEAGTHCTSKTSLPPPPGSLSEAAATELKPKSGVSSGKNKLSGEPKSEPPRPNERNGGTKT